MTTNVNFRIATQSDAENIFNVLSESQNESKDTNYTIERNNFDLWKNSFKNSFNSSNTLIILALVNNNVIGFVSCYILPRLELGKNYMVCEDVYLKPPYRRQGIGTLLFNQVKYYAKHNHCKYISLSTLIDNKIAQNFYKKQGFENNEICYSYNL